ncbi:MAG: hypothetical protein ABSD75_04935 [Terriglobales bacterium]
MSIYCQTADRSSTLGSTCFIERACAMTLRIRHCVECPKCLTRYLVGFSPYRNGSYLVPLAKGAMEEWILYCSCGRPPISSRWSWAELKSYTVSELAYGRGYGPPEEIVRVRPCEDGNTSIG